MQQDFRQQDYASILEDLRKIVSTTPDDIFARARLGDMLWQCGHFSEAMVQYEEASRRDPVLHQHCRNPDAEPTEEMRAARILENCRHILTRYPRHAPAVYAQACALQTLGRMEEACITSMGAIARNPTLPVYYHIIVYNGTAEQKSKALRALEKLRRQEEAMPPDGRAMLHFLLAKLYDDGKRFSESFTELQIANRMKRELIDYDEAGTLRHIRAIATTYPHTVMTKTVWGADRSDVPVFVTGMLRSGTTLVEQILASHPDVYGAGELTLLPELVETARGGDTPDKLTTDEITSRIGMNYLAGVKKIAPKAKHIVDKFPLNFLHIGLIHRALPGARIIHVRRNAIDTCISCYNLTFAGPIDFAYDLGELGRYYRAYEFLMAHWRSVLPEGAMLEVQYEDIVADLEGQARRLTDFCGLTWDERCLSFHKTKRAVNTASVAQVRKPIYKTAIGRAHAYDAWLGPLKNALAGK